MKYLSLVICIFFISCNVSKTKHTAQQIIDKAILYSGANKIENSEITFQFRDKKYTAKRRNSQFKLSRTYTKDSLFVNEFISNTGFERHINNTAQEVSEKVKNAVSNSINSVHYFAVLPFGLNDNAVYKKLLESVKLKGKEYYKIEITFSENGGGEDYQDVFIYWVGKEDFLIDYLAYSYHTNGGGKRFRVLKEQCVKSGVRFVDYHNYSPKNKEITLQDIDKSFENNQLKKVSEIVLQDIEVVLLD